MRHDMRLQREPFEQIKSGKKTIELRLYDEKRQRIRVGDTVTFTAADASDDSIAVRVEALHRFANFRELFDVLPMEKCGFKTGQNSEVMEDYYSKEEQSRHGVVGIEIKVLF